MTGEIHRTSTEVPIDGERDVTIEPEKPWPSAYRGSQYSLVESSQRERDKVVRWQHRELPAHCEPPTGLTSALQAVGKSNGEGTGSFRITADGEVLTKVPADTYPYSDDAPQSDGWIAVYVGQLEGEVGFDEINNNPDPKPGEIAIWDGFPFNHGETWVVSVHDTLIWKRGTYRFESAFDHDELIDCYNQYRKQAGRLYVNEHGHVWINAPPSGIPGNQEQGVQAMAKEWRQTAQREGRSQALRLVTRRLEATSPDDDPKNGHLPIYIGHLSEFDGGVIPKPVVTDPSYFVDMSRKPTDSFN